MPSGVEHVGENKRILAELGQGGVLVGATAWGFARPDLELAFDYLFVDEAGQFCLANAIAVGTATRNLILIGDQMQLPQPVQANHPGREWEVCPRVHPGEYATIPKDFGVLLNVSWRMHPSICDWVSAAVYERRLIGGCQQAHQDRVAFPAPVRRASRRHSSRARRSHWQFPVE